MSTEKLKRIVILLLKALRSVAARDVEGNERSTPTAIFMSLLRSCLTSALFEVFTLKGKVFSVLVDRELSSFRSPNRSLNFLFRLVLETGSS